VQLLFHSHEEELTIKRKPEAEREDFETLGISPSRLRSSSTGGSGTKPKRTLFLNSTLFDLPSPYLTKGMDKAVERIKRAIAGKEK
jgi:hypothetical protein